jgi:hypothetical protein
VREGQIFFFFLPSSSFFFFCFFTCVTNGKNRADTVGTMVDPGGRHNSQVHGIAGGASSTPSLSALLVPSDHRSVQLLPYPWWKDGLTNSSSSSDSSLSWIFTKLQKEIQFLVNASPPKKQKKKKSRSTLNTKSNLHFLSISLSRLTQHTIHLFWKPKQHNTIQLLYKPTQHNSLCSGNQTQNTHTHTQQQQQHNKTQKEKSLKKRATIPNLQTQKKMFFLTLTFNPPPPAPPGSSNNNNNNKSEFRNTEPLFLY